MSAIPESTRSAIESGHLAHLVTLNDDGTPQMTCVWVGLDGDEIVFASMSDRQKLRNLRRDPRVWLSIATGHRNPMGLEEYLVVQGVARIAEGGGAELLQRLAHTYLGPGVTFPPMRSQAPGFVVRITVERVGGVGPWSSD
jgi:PPOX class probable F420-dependent enzyme